MTGPGPHIRAAGPADAATLAHVVAASIQKLCVADHRDDPAVLDRWLDDKTPAAFAARIAGPTEIFVAEMEGRIVGVGEVDCQGQPLATGKITLNYVAPGWQGRGVSRALLLAMEGVLRAKGCATGLLTATTTARAFYLAQGWRPDGPPRPGRWITGHPMTKPLSPCPPMCRIGS